MENKLEEAKKRDAIVSKQMTFLKKENKELAVIVENLELQIKHYNYTAQLDAMQEALAEIKNEKPPIMEKPKLTIKK